MRNTEARKIHDEELERLVELAMEAYYRSEPTPEQQAIIHEALIFGPEMLEKYSRLLIEKINERASE